MMKYKISKEARNDLKKIWLYTFENWSLEQADRYYDLIFNEIEYLQQNPTYGKDCGKIKKGYRRTKVKSHYIFYRINSERDEIEIIRILHQKMNVETRLIE